MINIQDLLEQEIGKRVDRREVFTAHDIKVAVREQGHWVEHEAARQVVQSYYFTNAMGDDYVRSIIDVGAESMPWAYHPYNVDPNTHPSAKSNQASATLKSGTSVTLLTSAKSSDKITKTVTTKNRLMFPASMLREVGVAKGDHVFVGFYASDGKLSVSRDYPTDADQSKGLIVDEYCNLLVGLNSYGLDGTTYEMSVEGSVITALPV